MDLSPIYRKFVEQLCNISGASGSETPVSEFIISQLPASVISGGCLEWDHAFSQSPYGGTCGNLILRLEGTIPGPRRLFLAHLDSVPNCLGAEPKIEEGFIHSANHAAGLPADNRAGCAIVLGTAIGLLQAQVEYPPTTFLWTIQEEVGLIGAKSVSLEALGNPEFGFNFDGRYSNKVVRGANGIFSFSVEICGKSTHAGTNPEGGISALLIASQAISRLAEEGWFGRIEKDGKRGSCNIGRLKADDESNVVNGRASLDGEVRSHDPAFRRRILNEVQRIFAESLVHVRNAAGDNGTFLFSSKLDFESFDLPEDSAPVKAMCKALEQLGHQPSTVVSDGGLDANALTARGVPTATLGCGQEFAHSLQARLNLEEFDRACAVAWHLASTAI